jgi:hypothetical protein
VTSSFSGAEGASDIGSVKVAADAKVAPNEEEEPALVAAGDIDSIGFGDGNCTGLGAGNAKGGIEEGGGCRSGGAGEDGGGGDVSMVMRRRIFIVEDAAAAGVGFTPRVIDNFFVGSTSSLRY